MIKFNTVGKIIKGEYPEWYIVIVDKRKEGSDNKVVTGGIYIFQSNNISFSGEDDGIVYDDWVQDLEGLDIFFSEPKWDIQWLDIENPVTV